MTVSTLAYTDSIVLAHPSSTHEVGPEETAVMAECDAIDFRLALDFDPRTGRKLA